MFEAGYARLGRTCLRGSDLRSESFTGQTENEARIIRKESGLGISNA